MVVVAARRRGGSVVEIRLRSSVGLCGTRWLCSRGLSIVSGARLYADNGSPAGGDGLSFLALAVRVSVGAGGLQRRRRTALVPQITELLTRTTTEDRLLR